jgi:glycosyltransferase involved in cell wall biosynthesis
MKNAKKDNTTSREPLLSILMPTLDDRKHFFNHISQKLSNQIKQVGEKDVEFLFYCDNRERTTGHKRNVLLQQARGKFVVFVDDDDDVSPNYVDLICKAIRQHDVDAIGICGIYTENGLNPKPFITGRKYNWETIGNTYCRFVNHISPIKRTIAQQFDFPDLTIGEDYQWTMAIRDSGLVKTDYIIQDKVYFYEFRPHK